MSQFWGLLPRLFRRLLPAVAPCARKSAAASRGRRTSLSHRDPTRGLGAYCKPADHGQASTVRDADADRDAGTGRIELRGHSPASNLFVEAPVRSGLCAQWLWLRGLARHHDVQRICRGDAAMGRGRLPHRDAADRTAGGGRRSRRPQAPKTAARGSIACRSRERRLQSRRASWPICR